MKNKKSDAFIAKKVSSLFEFLKKYTILETLSRQYPKLNLNSDGNTEKYVICSCLFSLLVAIMFYVYSYHLNILWFYFYSYNLHIFLLSCCPFIGCIILICGALRIIEIIIVQADLLFDKEVKTNPIQSYRRSLILLLFNLADITFWFMAGYIYLGINFDILSNKGTSIIEYLYSSFVIMTTFGSLEIKDKSNIELLLIYSQSIIGLFMTLISLARFISLLPKLKTSDDLEKEGALEEERIKYLEIDRETKLKLEEMSKQLEDLSEQLLVR